MGYRKDLKHRITLRVSDNVKAWADEVGLDGVRAVLERHLAPAQAQVENLAAKPVEAAPVPVDLAAKPKAEKAAGAAVPKRAAIPMNLAEQVAAIAARREAQKRAAEGMSGVGRLLAQYRK